MEIKWRWLILPVVFCAIGLQATQHDSRVHSNEKAVDDPDWSELKSSMDKMHMGLASVEPSRDSDVNFVRMMLPHHQAALDMAKTQLYYGKDPQMRRLAQEILTDQQSEIDLMQLWLKDHATNR